MTEPVLQVEAAGASAEGSLVVSLPVDSVRSVIWFLDRLEADGTWTQSYAIDTNPEGSPQPVLDLASEPFSAPDRGVRGAGPDVITVPTRLAPGTWRACPAGAQLGCIRFESIVDPAGSTFASVDDWSYLADGRSFVAVAERTGGVAHLALEVPVEAAVTVAQLEVLEGDVWAPVTTIRAASGVGTFTVEGAPEGRPARLCLDELPSAVACVLLPPP